MLWVRRLLINPIVILIHICDVDSRAITNFSKAIAGIQDTPTTGFKDFRKSLESKDIDAFIISAPDHGMPLQHYLL
jgi:predicted dehydrogenase